MPQPARAVPSTTALAPDTGPPLGAGPRVLGALGVAVLVWGTVVASTGARARPALATVVHHLGFEATVLGWTSWYGSYDLGATRHRLVHRPRLGRPRPRLRLPPDRPHRSPRRHQGGHGLGGDHGRRRHRSRASGRPDARPARSARCRLPLRPSRRRHVDHRPAGRIRGPGGEPSSPRPRPSRPTPWPMPPGVARCTWRSSTQGTGPTLGSGGGHA